jgi:hypothetical protein
MGSSMPKSRFLLALYVIALLALPATALAGPHRLPPDVDLDPDRSMPFDRLPKTAFDHRELDTMKKVLASHVMDPAVDPYTTIVKPSKYEPYTGQIRDSINDVLRDMRHNQDLARRFASSEKNTTGPVFGPKPPPNLLAGMARPDRLLRSPVVDPMVALKKQQQNDDKDDEDSD